MAEIYRYLWGLLSAAVFTTVFASSYSSPAGAYELRIQGATFPEDEAAGYLCPSLGSTRTQSMWLLEDQEQVVVAEDTKRSWAPT